MSYIDLREIIANKDDEPETYEAWSDALSGIGIDWFAQNGGVAIPEDEFEDYARDYAVDIGHVAPGLPWPATDINWEAAANDLKMDYFEVEVEGTTYYLRS